MCLERTGVDKSGRSVYYVSKFLNMDSISMQKHGDQIWQYRINIYKYMKLRGKPSIWRQWACTYLCALGGPYVSIFPCRKSLFFCELGIHENRENQQWYSVVVSCSLRVFFEARFVFSRCPPLGYDVLLCYCCLATSSRALFSRWVSSGHFPGRFFPNQACLGVLTVRERDRSGWNGPAVPPRPCGGSPSAAT